MRNIKQVKLIQELNKQKKIDKDQESPIIPYKMKEFMRVGPKVQTCFRKNRFQQEEANYNIQGLQRTSEIKQKETESPKLKISTKSQNVSETRFGPEHINASSEKMKIRKPKIPKLNETTPLLPRNNINFIIKNKEYILKNEADIREKKAMSEAKHQSSKLKHKNFGKIPDYIYKFREELIEKADLEMRTRLRSLPIRVTDQEKEFALKSLVQAKEYIESALSKLPIELSTANLQSKKARFEAKLEGVNELISLISG